MHVTFLIWRPVALGAPELIVIVIILLVFFSAQLPSHEFVNGFHRAISKRGLDTRCR